MPEPGDVFPRRELPGRSEDWGRHVEQRMESLEKLASSLKTNLGGVATAVGANQGAAAQVSQDLSAANAEPNPPSNVAISNNFGRWIPGGSAVSRVTVTWDAVTQATNGTAISPALYEVWAFPSGGTPAVVATSSGTSAFFDVAPGNPQTVFVRARSTKGVWSGPSLSLTVTPAFPADVTPASPTGLTISKNVGSFAPDNSAVTDVEISWTPVTVSTAGDGIKVVQYEIWQGTDVSNGAPVGAVADPKFAIRLAAGTTVVFRVRALSDIGAWGSLSAGLTVAAVLPPVPMATPSTPTVTGVMGGVQYAFDGKTSSGADFPLGFANVRAMTAPSGAGPWTATGTPLRSAGTGTVRVASGTVVYVRYEAYDQLGRLMGTSALASTTALGIPIDEIPGLEDDLDAIQYTADGKNRVIVSISEPTTGATIIARNAFINPRAVTNAGWVHSVSGGGAVSSATIETIAPWFPNGPTTAYKGVVSTAGTNYDLRWTATTGYAPVTPGTTYSLGQWQSFSLGGSVNLYVQWRDGAGAVVRTDTATSAYTAVANTPFLAKYENLVAPAGSTYVTFYVRLMGAIPVGTSVIGTAATLRPAATLGDYFDGSTPSEVKKGYTWAGTVNASESLAYTSDVSVGDMWLQLDPTGASVVAIKVWNGSSWAPQVLYAQDIVAAGSIIGQNIKAGTLSVDLVEPAFGENLNIQANSMVEIIVGQQATQSSQIADANDAIGAAQATASTASTKATSAQSTANSASSLASTANTTANAAKSDIEAQQTVYQFTSTEARIQTPGGEQALVLSPERASFQKAGVTLTYWEGGQMVVPQIVVQTANLGSHQWTAFSSGRSIIQPLSN